MLGAKEEKVFFSFFEGVGGRGKGEKSKSLSPEGVKLAVSLWSSCSDELGTSKEILHAPQAV